MIRKMNVTAKILLITIFKQYHTLVGLFSRSNTELQITEEFRVFEKQFKKKHSAVQEKNSFTLITIFFRNLTLIRKLKKY